MRPRTTLADLTRRSAPALHRTLPTWAREPKPDGVEYRLYVPVEDGVAAFTRDTFPLDTPRASVAAQLRTRRRWLWSQRKTTTEPQAPAAPAPVAMPAPATPLTHQPTQGALF